MESYKLIKPLAVNVARRDRLYFDRYEYCFSFGMDEMSCLREMDHDTIDRMIHNRNTWRQRSPNFGGSWRGRRGQITEEQRVDCHAMCDFLQAQQDYKLMISGDWGYIYTNNMSLIRTMETLNYVRPLGIKQSVIDRPRDTLLIKNSRHEFRTYFRAQRLEQRQRFALIQWLTSQESLRIGPGLTEFVKNEKHYYINDNFFIDHDGMGVITMLNLVLPKATRKTVKLLRDK